tara:strand:+ start:50203 stop:51435 length:1233 start_codon:yes stop_codon:yes gene_type:complete
VREGVEKLNGLKSIFPSMKMKKRMNVVIVPEIDAGIRWSSGELKLSRTHAMNSRFVAKSILSKALQENFPLLTTHYVNVFTDLLDSILSNQLSIGTEREDSIFLSGSSLRLSLSDYCRYPGKSVTYYEFCHHHLRAEEILPESHHQMSKQPTIWAASGLFSKLLFNYYQNLSLSDRQNFTENLYNYIENFKWEVPVVLGSEQQYLDWIERELDRVESELLLDARNWNHLVLSEMYGKPVSIETLVMVGPSHLKSLIELESNSKANPMWSMAYFTEDFKIYVPSLGYIENPVEEVMVSQLVLVDCGAIQLSHPVFRKNIAPKMIYINDCTPGRLASYVDRIQQGQIKNHLYSNDDLSFIEFHMPSVQMALRKSKKIAHSFAEQFSWQSVSYEDETKSFRPLAPIEGVVRFR